MRTIPLRALLFASALSSGLSPGCGGAPPANDPATGAAPPDSAPAGPGSPTAPTSSPDASPTSAPPAPTAGAATPPPPDAGNKLLGAPFEIRSALAVAVPGSDAVAVTAYGAEVTCADREARRDVPYVKFLVPWRAGARPIGTVSAHADAGAKGNAINSRKDAQADVVLTAASEGAGRASATLRDPYVRVDVKAEFAITKCR